MSTEYTLTVGMEVHAELNTKTKMFCGCKNAPHESKPNTHICEICLAHPGTLPAPNEHAIQKVLLVGHALGATVADYSEFDRKNYFYPDIPKAYQISQYAYPLVHGGALAGVAITRVHLEEDTARSQHEREGVSLVDFNRAGVPLLELVTEPDITSAEQAGTFAKELQLLLRTLGVSEANMERGEMRVEANISVSRSDTLGTKAEVKNLNSFRSVSAAIAYEYDRQVALLEAGEVVPQETRGWDENTGKTFTQRSKESADDYRYFPDPDIRKLRVSEYEEFNKSRIDEITPELPDEKRKKYAYLGLTSDVIETLLDNQTADAFFAAVLACDTSNARLAANYIVSDLPAVLAARELVAHDLYAAHFVTLMQMVADDRLTSRVAKDLLERVVCDGVDPEHHAKANNLLQVSDESAVLAIVDRVIAENESVVADYRSGKESALQYLVGQGMKLSNGSANPKLLAQLLTQRINT